ELDVIARQLNWSISQLCRYLSHLKDKGIISLQLSEPSFFFKPLVSTLQNQFDLEEVESFISDYLTRVENEQVRKVEKAYELFLQASERPSEIRELITEYFNHEDDTDPHSEPAFFCNEKTNENIITLIRSDVKVLRNDKQFQLEGQIPTARALARILHGLP